MKICICDDDKMIHRDIKERIQPFFSETSSPTITHCYSGEEIISLFQSSNYFDIIFLDVEMGNKSGIEAAGEIKGLSPDTIIIFVSSHKNYVFDAFKCEALHYIVKPIKQVEFEDVFNRALHKYRLVNNRFPVSWKHTRNNLKISEIMYIEAFRRRLIIHTSDKKEYEHIGKLSEAYEALYPHGFVYVHQGYIVNMHYIHTFTAEHCVLDNGEKVMVSTRKRADALNMFSKYIQKWKW